MMMKKVGTVLHEAIGYVLRAVFRILILLVFRPKRVFASEEARKNFPKGPCVFACNHVQALDGAVIETMLPTRRVWGLTAKDLLEKSVGLRLLMSFCRGIPIDREHFSMAWLRAARGKLKAGDDILICPEGKCQEDRVIHPFKPGFALLAASAGVPVVPVFHNGRFEPLIGRRFQMMIGEPIIMTPPPEGLNEQELNREALVVENVIREMQRRMENRAEQEK